MVAIHFVPVLLCTSATILLLSCGDTVQCRRSPTHCSIGRDDGENRVRAEAEVRATVGDEEDGDEERGFACSAASVMMNLIGNTRKL